MRWKYQCHVLVMPRAGKNKSPMSRVCTYATLSTLSGIFCSLSGTNLNRHHY